MNTPTDHRQELSEKIIEYAMQQFYQRGVKAVKMDEISQGLHVSKRTVYEIFGDKEEMLLDGLHLWQSRLKANLENFAHEGDHNVLDILAYYYHLEIERNHEISPIFLEDLPKYPRVIEYLEELHVEENSQRLKFFAKGIEDGLFRNDVNYELFTEIGHIAAEEIMKRQVYKDYSMKTIFDNYFMVIVRGICTERGLSKLKEAMKANYNI